MNTLPWPWLLGVWVGSLQALPTGLNMGGSVRAGSQLLEPGVCSPSLVCQPGQHLLCAHTSAQLGSFLERLLFDFLVSASTFQPRAGGDGSLELGTAQILSVGSCSPVPKCSHILLSLGADLKPYPWTPCGRVSHTALPFPGPSDVPNPDAHFQDHPDAG